MHVTTRAYRKSAVSLLFSSKFGTIVSFIHQKKEEKMSLSQRFAKLKGPAATGKTNRQVLQRAQTSTKRGNVMANKRGLSQKTVQKSIPTSRKNGGTNKGRKGGINVGVARAAVKGKGKGKSGAAGKKGGKGGGGRDGKTKAPDAGNLDMAMDAYWHKAGKGPDPKQAALDRQMDTYFKSKPTEAAGAATEEA